MYEGRREGRKEGTPADVTSSPGVFLGSSSGLSRYACRRGETEQPAPAADFRQPGWSHAADGTAAEKVKSVNSPLSSALKSEGEREEKGCRKLEAGIVCLSREAFL